MNQPSRNWMTSQLQGRKIWQQLSKSFRLLFYSSSSKWPTLDCTLSNNIKLNKNVVLLFRFFSKIFEIRKIEERERESCDQRGSSWTTALVTGGNGRLLCSQSNASVCVCVCRTERMRSRRPANSTTRKYWWPTSVYSALFSKTVFIPPIGSTCIAIER